MRRFLPVLGVLVVVVAFAALVPKLSTGKTADTKWRPLPRGGEIALYDVTVGTHHAAHYPEERLLDRMRYTFRRRSLRPLSQSSGRSDPYKTSMPSIAIWLAYRNTSSPSPLGSSELIIPDGQIYSTGGLGGSGSGTAGLMHIDFDVLPYTAEKLTFAATIQDERFQWEFPNPAYQSKAAAGCSTELPQTSSVGEYELTLKEIGLVHKEYPPTNWQAEPVFRVSRQGKDVSNWFKVSATNEERGLLSAPSWTITATLSRTSAYPFTSDEIEWLGRYDKGRLDALKPAEHALFPLTNAARARGIILAGVFGPGQYDVGERGVLRSQALAQTHDHSRPDARVVPNTEDLTITLDRSSMLLLSKSGGVSVFRNDNDNQIKVRSRWSHGYKHRAEIYDAPEEALRVGIAEVKETSMEERPIQFVVKPPQIPKGVDPRTGEQLDAAAAP